MPEEQSNGTENTDSSPPERSLQDVTLEVDEPRTTLRMGDEETYIWEWSGHVKLHSDTYESVNVRATATIYDERGEPIRVKTTVFHDVERMSGKPYTLEAMFADYYEVRSITDYEIELVPLKAGAVEKTTATEETETESA